MTVNDAGPSKRGPIGQVEKGSAYFGTLGLEVDHFAPLWHLLKIAQLLETELNRLSARHGLSIADFHLLCALMMEGEDAVRATDLAHALNVSDAALSGRLRRMVAMELVDRHADPDDRRSHRLIVTETGVEAVQGIARAIEQDASFISWFRRLQQEDREQLAALLGDFHTFLNRDFLPVNRPEK